MKTLLVIYIIGENYKMAKMRRRGTNSDNPMRHKFVDEELDGGQVDRRRIPRGGRLVMGGPGSRTRRRPTRRRTIEESMVDNTPLQELNLFADGTNTNTTPTKPKFKLFKDGDDTGDIWNYIGMGSIVLLLMVLGLGLLTLIGALVYEGMGIWGITIPIMLPIVLYVAYWVGRRVLE
jgi:hypothetical protein